MISYDHASPDGESVFDFGEFRISDDQVRKVVVHHANGSLEIRGRQNVIPLSLQVNLDEPDDMSFVMDYEGFWHVGVLSFFSVQRNTCSTITKELLDKHVSANAEVFRHLSENTGNCPKPHRFVSWNCQVMLALFKRDHPHMAACLARDSIAQFAQDPRKLFASEVSRQSHAAITSSRTK